MKDKTEYDRLSEGRKEPSGEISNAEYHDMTILIRFVDNLRKA